MSDDRSLHLHMQTVELMKKRGDISVMQLFVEAMAELLGEKDQQRCDDIFTIASCIVMYDLAFRIVHHQYTPLHKVVEMFGGQLALMTDRPPEGELN